MREPSFPFALFGFRTARERIRLTRRPLSSRAAVAVLLTAATACGDRAAGSGAARDEAPARTAIDTVSDTIVVRVTAGEALSDVRSVVEEVRIGEADGPPEYMMAVIPFVAPTSDSSVYLFEQRPPEVRLYDASGRFVRRFGRSGQGPGEYSPTLNGIVADAEDNVAIWDYPAQRVTMFARDGSLRESWSNASYGMLSIPTPAGIATDTTGAILLRNNFTLSAADSALVGRPNGPGLVRRHRGGTNVDTIRVPRLDRWPVGSISSGDPVHRVTRLTPPTPFAPSFMFGWSPLGYLVTVEGATYTIELHRRSEQPMRIERTVTPVSVDEEEHADLTMRAEYATREGLLRAQSLGIKEPPAKPPVPRSKPPITSFLIGRDGRIWVRLSQPGVKEPNPAPDTPPPQIVFEGALPPPPRAEFRWPEPDVYEVFEPDGRHLGRVRVPRGSAVRAAYGDRMWATVTDSADVPYVVRYRVDPPFSP